MAKRLLIYEKVVPVSKERHASWSIKSNKDYSFARYINSLPLMAVEFPSAASEYTIVFVGGQDADSEVMPAIILGVSNENLFIDDSGDWKAKYVPAFIRRYPFVFSSTQSSERFTLCIDEDYSGFNQEGRGERLFDSDGEQTQYLQNTLEFLKEYQAQFQRTQLFCKKLKELDLLEPMQAALAFPSGKRTALDGFMGINREKLKSLSGETLAELAATDELELIYLHLHSMGNFAAVGELIGNSPETSEAPLEAAAVG